MHRSAVQRETAIVQLNIFSNRKIMSGSDRAAQMPEMEVKT